MTANQASRVASLLFAVAFCGVFWVGLAHLATDFARLVGGLL